MIGFGTLVMLGLVIGSISVSMFIFTDNLTAEVTVESGGIIQVGDVEFDIQYVSNYEILEKKSEYLEFEKNLVIKGIDTSETPDGIYFQIQITAHNMSTETIRITGGQFHLYDSDNTKYNAVFIGYGDDELSLIDLEPNNSVTLTTQFDIPYDDQMKYRVGIIPDRYGLQDSQERGFICVKNC
tara:strand:- start:1389 stop:1937 length:549 start_codon:yes stop_codon:yes gene_type:complete